MIVDTAVVYLARLAEGFGAFEAFASSYRRFPADQAHDLVVICKGRPKAGERAALQALFGEVAQRIVEVDDEIGFDIHAYSHVVPDLPHEYLCFCNSFTLIQAEGWLGKLYAALVRPGVGLVGATGSYESLLTSSQVIDQVTWTAGVPCAYDPEIGARFEWILAPSQASGRAEPRRLYRRLRRAAGDRLFRRPQPAAMLERARAAWTQAFWPGGVRQGLLAYPAFPNPHIRSNVFMLRRQDFLAVPLRGRTKEACSRFESGCDGLSLSILRSGRSLMVVGADGVAYDVPRWADARNFRSGGQENLLAADNQTAFYGRASADVRDTLSIMTWGGFGRRDPAPTLLGVPFARDEDAFRRLQTSEADERCRPAAPAPAGRLLISIVIPTHNRSALTLDAIRTVQAQTDGHWEIAVFDNASEEPLGEAIRALGDPRIRYQRSDDFLPVTKSWNRALDMARGDYVTLIGDDDGLAPGFFTRIEELVAAFDHPDVIFSSLYHLSHPGVTPGEPAGYVRTLPMADFLEFRTEPFRLDRQEVRRSVENSLRMRRSFMFNMPAFTTRRVFLDRIRVGGAILHSPFPDYYFANVALARAESIVAEPRPLAFQGISKVSFGFTLLNDRTEVGFAALGPDEDDAIRREVATRLLPGPRYNSQYIVTMAYVANEVGWSAEPDYGRYRRLQILDHITRRAPSLGRFLKVDEDWRGLSLRERAWASVVNVLHKLALREPRLLGWPFRKIERAVDQHLFRPKLVRLNRGDVTSGSELYAALATRRWTLD